MAWRVSIEIPPIEQAGNSLPFVSTVGSMLFTGGIMGADAATGLMPDDLDQQVTNCFANLASTMARAGGSMDDVGFLRVYIRDSTMRARVNPVWLQHFPDEHSRPRRHTIVQQDLGCSIQLQVVAVLKT